MGQRASQYCTADKQQQHDTRRQYCNGDNVTLQVRWQWRLDTAADTLAISYSEDTLHAKQVFDADRHIYDCYRDVRNKRTVSGVYKYIYIYIYV